MSTGTGRIAPLQIRSQGLAGVAAHRIGSGLSAFDAYPLDQAAANGDGKGRRGHWRERDLRRALLVARRAGLADYRVEIATDGTISIVVTGRKARTRR